MKKFIKLLFVFSIGCMVIFHNYNINAVSSIAIDESHFPDDIFREFILNEYDVDHNGVLSEREYNNVTDMYVDNMDIHNLKGLEYFSNLRLLSCNNNKLTELNVKNNTMLETLACYENHITELDISENKNLKELYCNDNWIKLLDIHANTYLEHLYCYNNQLCALDISNCNNLKVGYFDENYHEILIENEQSYDIASLPGFDVSKASNWNGGTIDGNRLTINNDIVTYDYDIGLGVKEKFHIKKHTHNYICDSIKTSTCQEEGEGKYICSCEENYVKKLPMKEHIYQSKITKATIDIDGKIEKKCENCGKEVVTNISQIEKVSLSKTKYIYDGNVKKPSVIIKNSNGKNIAASQYNVVYSGARKNVGKYNVKITMKGNYTGTFSRSFVINPKGTSISSMTGSKKACTVKWKKQNKQITGYQIQLATNKDFTSGKKLMTVKGMNSNSKKISNLKSKKNYYVRIRTYKTVNDKKFYSAWSGTKKVKTK